MSILRLLNVGASGAAASTFGVNVASQNAANVATDGFARRSVTMNPTPGPPAGGGGVQSSSAHRIVDGFVTQRRYGAEANAGEASTRASALRVIDDVFTEDAGGVQAALQDLEAAATDVAARPSDLATRRAFLSAVSNVANAFRNAATGLAAARSDANAGITERVGAINEGLTRIADLNRRIGQSEVSGAEASDLRDQRDALIRTLSEQAPIRTVESPTGGVTVYLGSSLPLVDAEGNVHGLSTQIDATTGDVGIFRQSAGAQVDVSNLFTSGGIGGLIKARDGALTDVRNGLDQLAYDVATHYNVAHEAGYDLDGNPGQALFVAPAAVSGAATGLTVNATIASDPRRVAAASDPAMLPGDNRNALILVQLADTKISSGGTRTATEAFADLVASGGTALAGANTDAETTDAALSQVRAVQESISGVSVDEELVSLVRYQRAYQASLKVIQTADEMLAELMKLKS